MQQGLAARPLTLSAFVQAMPKVELHVHLEGAIAPATLLMLAKRHGIALPATTVEGLRDWYSFSSFAKFVEIYLTISSCLRTPDDIELIARQFLVGQAAQNVKYTEVTYTAYTHFAKRGLAFADQLAALNRARAWAEEALGVSAGYVIDIPRVISAEEGVMVADWAIAAMGAGVVALGLGGPEVGNPAERYAEAFARAKVAGLRRVPHAGETVGAESVWAALRSLDADRIGHGVRCLEDASLVEHLRDRQVPLEICPTSNLCLKVVPSLAEHPLPRLLAEGLFVTLNSDDPPMFGTTLSGEYLAVARTFGLATTQLEALSRNALSAAFLPVDQRRRLELAFDHEFAELRANA